MPIPHRKKRKKEIKGSARDKRFDAFLVDDN